MSWEEEKRKIINELLKEWNIYNDVSFNEFNLGDKVSQNPFLLMKYRDQWNTEKLYLDELNDKLEELIGKQYHKYRFEYDEELTKTEIEKYYLPQDKKIKKMKDIIKQQEIRVKFFESCVKGLDRSYWAMKEFRENQKL